MPRLFLSSALQYLLLLTELLKRSESVPSMPGSALFDLRLAKERIGNIASSINASLHQKENQLIVRAIEKTFDRDARYQELVTPTRYLIREGPLKKRYGKGSRHLSSSTVYHFFLFSDILIYATFSRSVIGSKCRYQMKHLMPLSDMSVEAAPGAKGKNKDIAITTRSSGEVKSFDLSCTDTHDRDSWLKDIQAAIYKLQHDSRVFKTMTFDGMDPAEKVSTSYSSKLKAMMGV
jgi:hypothetical protein